MPSDEEAGRPLEGAPRPSLPGAGRGSRRLWADEMLGRLARYLRMVGCDVAYERGLEDAEVQRRCRAEGRQLLTRDRRLAETTAEAVLLRRADLQGQWAELRRAWPDLPSDVAFRRCTLCNGELVSEGSPAEGPPDRPGEAGRSPARELYRCRACGHLYWEGSHTRSLRDRLARWSVVVAP